MKKLAELAHMTFNPEDRTLTFQVTDEGKHKDFMEIVQSMDIKLSDYIDRTSLQGNIYKIPYELLDKHIEKII